MKVVKIEINNSIAREFLKNVAECDYGISNDLNKEFVHYKKNFSDLTEIEIQELMANVFTTPPIFRLYNLEDADGNLILPMIYNDFFLESENKEIFSLGKYGIKSIDLFNKKGKLLYKDAYWINFHTEYYVEITEQNSRIKIVRYNPETEELEFLGEPTSKLIDRLISFKESRFYFNNGFVDENFKAVTPQCFDNGKFFNEGLAPVCLNGKWGYIDKMANVVIDFTFGAAEQFVNGKARVFILKSEFQNEKGVWMESTTYQGYAPSQFLELFPEFIMKVRKPLCFLRENSKTVEQLNEAYHYYAEGVNEAYGYWAEINTKGAINGNVDSRIQVDKNYIEKKVNTIDEEYWFNYIIANSNSCTIISELPDVLFMDKNFVLRILERLPNFFQYFSIIYSDDMDVAELVFNLSHRNFDFFSERLRLIYNERYNQLMIEEGQQLFEIVTPNQILDDDLPF
jgi:hypothetical protein